MVEKPKGEGDSRRSEGEGEDYRGGHNFKKKKTGYTFCYF
jgi:hypothetical protein